MRPPSKLGVKVASSVLVIYFAAALLIGRGVVAILQGSSTIIFSLEGYNGALRYSKRRIKTFLIYLFFNTCVCLIVGSLALEKRLYDCAEASHEQSCEELSEMYAFVEFGGAGLSVLFLFVVTAFYRSIPSEKDELGGSRFPRQGAAASAGGASVPLQAVPQA